MHAPNCRLTPTVFVCTALLVPQHQLCAQRDTPVATIQVDVRGCFGHPVRTSKLEIILERPFREAPRRTQSGSTTFKDVPYGDYRLTVTGSGGGVGYRNIAVNEKDMWVIVGLFFPSERSWPGAGLTIQGSIKPWPRKGDWWVRVDGVFIEDKKDARVSRAGGFTVSGLDMGTYMVQVFEGSSVRHAETVEIDLKRRVTTVNVALP